MNEPTFRLNTMYDGRKATLVAWLTRDFQPATEDRAELIKIVYEDGGSEIRLAVSEQKG